MKYKKKPEIVEAMQFTGDNDVDCMLFCPLIEYNKVTSSYVFYESIKNINIYLEKGDWIVKNENDDFLLYENNAFHFWYEVY